MTACNPDLPARSRRPRRQKTRVSLVAGLFVVLAGLTGCSDSNSSDEDTTKPVKPPAPAASGDGSPHVLIGYYSLSGRTKQLAAAVAEGVARVPGVTVTVKKVADITREDLDQADGLVLGCPTHYANLPGQMKVIIDNWSWKWKIDFTNKVGGAFATGGETTGGKEHVVISLLLYMLNNRMILVGPLYEKQTAQFGAMGATAVTGGPDPGVGKHEREDGRKLGARVAAITKQLLAPSR